MAAEDLLLNAGKWFQRGLLLTKWTCFPRHLASSSGCSFHLSAVRICGFTSEILAATIDTAVQMKAIRPAELERVIVDITVQEKAVAHPTDRRLLKTCRRALVKAAEALDMQLKQTYAKEGNRLRWQAGRYGNAQQYRRMHRAVAHHPRAPAARLRTSVQPVCPRAAHPHAGQEGQGQALRAARPEVECISKGKVAKRYEFGVKVGVAVTHHSGLMVGARSCPGNPYDGHTLAEQLQQTNILMQRTGRSIRQVFTDLGYRGVDAENLGIELIHRGKCKSLSKQQRK